MSERSIPGTQLQRLRAMFAEWTKDAGGLAVPRWKRVSVLVDEWLDIARAEERAKLRHYTCPWCLSSADLEEADIDQQVRAQVEAEAVSAPFADFDESDLNPRVRVKVEAEASALCTVLGPW